MSGYILYDCWAWCSSLSHRKREVDSTSPPALVYCLKTTWTSNWSQTICLVAWHKWPTVPCTDPVRDWVIETFYGLVSRVIGSSASQSFWGLENFRIDIFTGNSGNIWYCVHNLLRLLSWYPCQHSPNCGKAGRQAYTRVGRPVPPRVLGLWVDAHLAGFNILELCTTSLVPVTGTDVSWNSGWLVLCFAFKWWWTQHWFTLGPKVHVPSFQELGPIWDQLSHEKILLLTSRLPEACSKRAWHAITKHIDHRSLGQLGKTGTFIVL